MYFSVLADETTDVAHHSQLSVSVRYVRQTEIVERFLEFVNPDSLSGAGLAAEIVNVLKRAGLETNYLVGQGYDGAAAMSGSFNGVQAEVRRLCGRQANYVHCAAHAFNLTLVKASEVTAIFNAFGVVTSVATFFRASSIRTTRLEIAIRAQDSALPKFRLKIPCQTRCVEKHEAIHTLYTLYNVVCEVLEEMTTERSASSSLASSLLNSLTKDDFVVALCVLHFVMSVTKPLSVALQSASNDLISAINHVHAVKEQLQNWRDSDKRFATIFSAAQDLLGEQKICMPRIVGRQIHRSNVPANTPLQYYQRSIFLPFLDGILSQMSTRFCDHEAIVLRLCGLLPRFAQTALYNEIQESVEQYADMLNGSPDVIELEFDTWKIACQKMDEPPADCINALMMCNPVFFPNIHTLLKIFATLPVSTATAERTFSVLKYLKSYLRSTMLEDRLNGLALAYIHRDIDVGKLVSEMVKLFALQQRKIPM
jgi:hypothetical protein